MNQLQQDLQNEQLKKLIESNIILNEEDRNSLDTILNDVDKLISTEIPKDITEHNKNTLFEKCKEYMLTYGRTFSGVKYTFGLSEAEYKLIKKIICQELEYDRQDLFIALVVKENFFDAIEKSEDWHKEKFKTEDNIDFFYVDIHEITRISHLIGQYKIKGLNKVSSNYAEVVRKIGDISKIYEYYNNLGNHMRQKCDNWIKGLVDKTSEEEKVLVNKTTKPVIKNED